MPPNIHLARWHETLGDYLRSKYFFRTWLAAKVNHYLLRDLCTCDPDSRKKSIKDWLKVELQNSAQILFRLFTPV